MRRYGALFAAVLCSLAVICLIFGGCHGSEEAAFVQPGRLTVRVTWPAVAPGQVDSQLIPARSESIHVQVAEGEVVLADALLVRPETPPWTTEAHFDPVKASAGALLKGAAYPNADGTGVAQAQADIAVVIPIGGEGYPLGGSPGDDVELALASTIVAVVVNPDPCQVIADMTQQLIATAKDAQDRAVLVPAAGAFTWTIANAVAAAAVDTAPAPAPSGAHADVDQNGLVTGLSVGPALATATENESGVSGDVEVNVIPQPYEYILHWQAGYSFGIRDVAVDNEGNLYVSDEYGEQIYHYDGQGTLLRSWPSPRGAGGPRGLAFHASSPAHIFATYVSSDSIRRYDASSLQVDAAWGTPGTASGEFYNPFGITVDPNGNVYVVDTTNDRLQKFDRHGTYLGQWGILGDGDGEFRAAMDVAADAEGNVYVTDCLNARVQKFDSAGNFLGWWGKDTDGYIGWHDPGGGAMSTDGSEPGAFLGPVGIAVGPLGSVYVVDAGNTRIQKCSPDGRTLSVFGSYGSDPGQFNDPYGIDVDALGNVYVVDTDNSRVQKFAPAGQVNGVVH